jgi:hypothetical protein
VSHFGGGHHPHTFGMLLKVGGQGQHASASCNVHAPAPNGRPQPIARPRQQALGHAPADALGGAGDQRYLVENAKLWIHADLLTRR